MLEPEHRLPLDRVLAAHGLSFDVLRQETAAIALFGSRAQGCARPSSDWDLLCIGRGRSRKLACLDLVWIDPIVIGDDRWLGGELAGHVAAHGNWMHGKPTWQLADVQFEMAARRKKERIRRRLESLTRAWNLLGPAYHVQEATLVRRDVQRLEYLSCGIAVPPTAFLDAAWREGSSWVFELREKLRLSGAPQPLAEAIVSASVPRADKAPAAPQ
jgi:hypothetical protein